MLALTATAALPSARALIIYSNPTDLTATDGHNVFIDLGSGGASGTTATSPLAGDTGDFQVISGFGAGILLNGNASPRLAYASTDLLKRFQFGDTIDSAVVGNMTANHGENINRDGRNDANWALGTTGYVGVSFISEGTTVYGWAQISVYAYAGSLPAVTVLDFAYEASGAPILAGATTSAVPETTSTALLVVFGAFSLVAFRGRRTVTRFALNAPRLSSTSNVLI